jgi:CheY-like chemotaxis protein
MDVALPGMNGIEALKEIRKINSIKGIPVIAVSASAMKGDKENFIAFGFDGYIPKPIDNNLFTRTLNVWLGKKR